VAHQYRLGSPLAAIIGLADATRERADRDEDVVARVRAIREIAFDALREAERGDPDSGQAWPPA
jgi:cysteine sulfinate desulfinase/cysteine desulfurase-like protein